MPEAQISKVAGLYSLGRKLGSGSFGDIYFAVDTQTGEEFAAKVESTKAKHPQLMYEAKLLKHLQGATGIANIRLCCAEGDYYVMIMDLLGPSLEDLFNICNRKFTLKTVLMIADQMLYRIEYLHSKNFIHRDIKPDNFLIGYGKHLNVIYLIDFGLAKKYRDPKTQTHIPYREDKSLTGTARYASINAHLGIEQSRRDDLDAIGYVLVYFSRGQLPWQGLKANTKEEKYHRIMECKQATSVEELCGNCPAGIAAYYNYCRALHFEDRPDYAYLRRILNDLFARQGFSNDGMFDWSQLVTHRESTSKTVGAAAVDGGRCSKDHGKQEVEDAGNNNVPGDKGHSRTSNMRQSGNASTNYGQRSRGSKHGFGLDGARHAQEPDGADRKSSSNPASPNVTRASSPTNGESAVATRGSNERPKSKLAFFASMFACGSKGMSRD